MERTRNRELTDEQTLRAMLVTVIVGVAALVLFWLVFQLRSPTPDSPPAPVPTPVVIYEDGLPMGTPLEFFMKDGELRWRGLE